ncbi:MAG: AEC family transporter, partial [Xanthomonadales bacterium]|nr:AEC family transporter [Xanthomonadales bacterium]
FDAFLLIALMMAVGVLCRRLGALPDNAAEVLNRFALIVCLPAAILRHAPSLAFDAQLIGLIAVPWLLLAATVIAVRLFERWRPLDASHRAVLLLCVPLGNTSFLGYPLVEAMLGKDALRYAVAYDQFGSFIILSTWGLWVLARYGGDARPTGAAILGRILHFPPFVALMVALLLMPAHPPTVVASVLERLSDALLPIVTLAVGLQLRFRVPRDERLVLAFGLSAKLLLLPLLALLLTLLFGMPTTMRSATVLESAMAPMITASALAISHRLAPGLAAALVGFGTPLSLLGVAAWHMLLAYL